MVKVAINGFGRIGRLVFRAGYKELEIVGINDLGDIETMAHLLKYDSVHGNFQGKVEVTGSNIVVDGKKIKFTSEKEPEKLPWKELGAEVVMECTGVFRTYEECEKHIKAGAKKVLLSAPPKDDKIKMVLRGVNDEDINSSDIISNCSCTTNSIAPIIKVLNDSFGIEKGLLTTVHSYTNDQRILDLPHKDLRRARAAAVNMIPTSTGAAIAVTQVIPALKGKLDGMSIRVPTPDGSITDLTVLTSKDVTEEEVNNAIKKASQRELKGIIEYSEEELVLHDIVGNPHSGILDSKCTKVIDGNLVKVCSWYDNEWGFSVRMVEMIKKMAK